MGYVACLGQIPEETAHVLQNLVSGSFHVKSSDFWTFFHGPPPILLKFGTLVGIV